MILSYDNRIVSYNGRVLDFVSPAAPVFFYRPVTIDRTKVAGTQTDFPVLVSGTYPFLKSAVNGGKVQSASGYDIAFYSNAALTDKLKWEVEKYEPTTGQLIAWVKVPSISSSADAVIYMSYGDSSITVDQSDKRNVWDSNYAFVYHLPDGTLLSANDSTANGLTATLGPATATPTPTTGKIGGAANFDGVNDYMSGYLNLATVQKMTLSFWANFPSYANNDMLLMELSSNSNNNIDGSFFVNPNSSAPSDLFTVALYSTGPRYAMVSFARPSTGIWHKYDFLFDRTLTSKQITGVFVDGLPVTLGYPLESLNTASSFRSDTMFFGSRGGSSLFCAASLDEVRMTTNALRPSDWIATEFNNQSSPSTFYTIGTEQIK